VIKGNEHRNNMCPRHACSDGDSRQGRVRPCGQHLVRQRVRIRLARMIASQQKQQQEHDRRDHRHWKRAPEPAARIRKRAMPTNFPATAAANETSPTRQQAAPSVSACACHSQAYLASETAKPAARNFAPIAHPQLSPFVLSGLFMPLIEHLGRASPSCLP
jgi:hypothetical protein